MTSRVPKRTANAIAAFVAAAAVVVASSAHAASESPPADAEAAFWRAIFDPAAPQPPAEGDLFSMVQGGGVVLSEIREPALRIEGVRIVYGTPMVSYVGCTEACDEVAGRINAALRASFGGGAPPTIDRQGRAGKVEEIEKAGRSGFGFAIRRTRVLEERRADGVRFRERELMEALAGVIREQDLEAVIVWSRGPVYVFNLWRRAHR